jgi:tRNA 2-selenouridine synthase SelU
MKNHQWVLEPFANMLSALCIVDTGLKRVAKIKDQIKNTENMEVLKLSICQQYNNLNAEMDKILSHIHKGKDLQEIKKMIEGYKKKLDYTPDEISLMNNVANRLYKNGKYYLD